jgi:hypothetical protein
VRFAWSTDVRVSEMERANIDDIGNDSHGPVLHVPFAAAKPSRPWRVVPLACSCAWIWFLSAIHDRM